MHDLQCELEQLIRDLDDAICRSVRLCTVLDDPVGEMCVGALLVRSILPNLVVIDDVVSLNAYLDVLNF